MPDFFFSPGNRHNTLVFVSTVYMYGKQGHCCMCVLHPICLRCIRYDKPPARRSPHYDCWADYGCCAAVLPGCCQNLGWTSGSATAAPFPQMLLPTSYYLPPQHPCLLFYSGLVFFTACIKRCILLSLGCLTSHSGTSSQVTETHKQPFCPPASNAINRCLSKSDHGKVKHSPELKDNLLSNFCFCFFHTERKCESESRKLKREET